MRVLLLILASSFAAASAAAQLDPTLVRQAEEWKSGEPPPARLLRFPDGKPPDRALECFKALGEEVGDYLSQIQNPNLLSALMLDDRAQPATVNAAARQLIALRGTTDVARLLASHPQKPARTELAVLAQLLRFPYAAIQVVRIVEDDMDLATAERVLSGMRDDLNAGMSWTDAYQKTAAQNPDLKARAKNPRSVQTLVCYLFDSVVSPSGFDISDYRIADDLLLVHLREVFCIKQGTLVLKTEEAVYLYHIKQYYEPAAD